MAKKSILKVVLWVAAVATTTRAFRSDADKCADVSVEVLFRTNAFANSIVPYGKSRHQGGTIISSEGHWNGFLREFTTNDPGLDVARRDVDFTTEKVAVLSYYTSATCSVKITEGWVECNQLSSISWVERWSMKVFMEVEDQSLGCQVSCQEAGQVVYVIAVPLDTIIDESFDLVVYATGPCLFGPGGPVPELPNPGGCADGECLDPGRNCAAMQECFFDPCDQNKCEEGTVCKSNFCGGCNYICEASPCPSGECRDSNGNCEEDFFCQVDPCESFTCEDRHQCQSNFCGGCNAECILETESESNVDCPKGQCHDPSGACAGELQCFLDPCEELDTCLGNEVCISNYCGGCHAECLPFESLPECPEGECRNPSGSCAPEGNCFFDPCESNSCSADESCEPNFCGGCLYICNTSTTNAPTVGSSTTPSILIDISTSATTAVLTTSPESEGTTTTTPSTSPVEYFTTTSIPTDTATVTSFSSDATTTTATTPTIATSMSAPPTNSPKRDIQPDGASLTLEGSEDTSPTITPTASVIATQAPVGTPAYAPASLQDNSSYISHPSVFIFLATVLSTIFSIKSVL